MTRGMASVPGGAAETGELAVGAALGRMFRVLGMIRRAKALHPKGALFDARIRRSGHEPAWGVPWLDEAGEDAALVRVSRSAGLPAGLPDILGLAIRIGPQDAPGDLLLASTGRGFPGRFLLCPRRRPSSFHSSLFPYRAAGSPVLLAAVPRPGRQLPTDPAQLVAAVRAQPWVLDLACASPRGPWRSFGTLELVGPAAAQVDPVVSFDPVRNVLPGFDLYGWSVRLREPSYAGSRAGTRRRLNVPPPDPRELRPR